MNQRKATKKRILLVSSLLILITISFVSSCQQDDFLDEKKDLTVIRHKPMPNVEISFGDEKTESSSARLLKNKFSKNLITHKTINGKEIGQLETAFGKVNLNKSVELKDSLNNISTSFEIKEEVKNPNVYLNLIVDKNEVVWLYKIERIQQPLRGFPVNTEMVSRYMMSSDLNSATPCDSIFYPDVSLLPNLLGGGPGGLGTGSTTDLPATGIINPGNGEGSNFGFFDNIPGNSGGNGDGGSDASGISLTFLTDMLDTIGGGLVDAWNWVKDGIGSLFGGGGCACQKRLMIVEVAPDSPCGDGGLVPIIIPEFTFMSFYDSLSPEQQDWWDTYTDESDLVKNYLYQNNYNDESWELAKDFLEITEEITDVKFERYLELLQLIEDNPWALIENCTQQNGMNTADYIDLYNHTIPPSCQLRLGTLGFNNQPISAGNVPCANIDYYGVEITTRPDFNNDGQPDTNAQIYQAFRNNFTDLASGEKENFQFSCTHPITGNNMTGDISWEFEPYSSYDANLFVHETNPITAILNINADATGFLPTLAADSGTIIVSGFTANNWTISTVMTPLPGTGTQPFSGNRQWGWIINQNGNLEIFTRAVDVARISKLLNVGANTECQQDTYYNVAEATWENMQQEIKQWINSPISNGGQATVKPKKAVRVNRTHIIALLTATETIDQIPSICN